MSSEKFICPQILSSLQDLLERYNVDEGHGIEHAMKVLDHAEHALAISVEPKDKNSRRAIKYAAILHDADDMKFFPESKNFSNARRILEEIIPKEPKVIELTLKMIGLVSCSKNGNSLKNVEKEWMLIPRLCDRLEALGEVGILRSWLYGKHINRPLFLPSTPRAITLKELEKIATPERFENYLQSKTSESMIDHFYDKILHIGKPEIMSITNNPYIKQEANRRNKIVIDFILQFGKTGKVDIRYLNKLRVRNSLSKKCEEL